MGNGYSFKQVLYLDTMIGIKCRLLLRLFDGQKNPGGALVRASNYLKTLLLSRFSHFLARLNKAGKEVLNMLFGGSKYGVKGDNGRLYLFKDGDQCTDITGGWINTVLGNGGDYSATISETLVYWRFGKWIKIFQA